MRRKYLLLLAAAAPVVSLAGPSVTGGCGCGGDETADAQVDARPEAATKPDAGSDAAADAATDAPAVPCSVPGYILDDAYDVTCGFCYASSASVLPPPIAWETCDPSAIPAGLKCRQMVEDWPVGQGAFGGEYISQVAPTWVQSDGTVTMAISRGEGNLVYRMVADADGPVHQAIVETSLSCTLGTYDLRDGRVAYRIYDSEQAPLSSYGGGCYGADLNQLRPRVFTHYHDTTDDRLYYVSSLGLFEGGTQGMYIKQYDWATGALIRTIDSAAFDNGFGIAHVWPVSDAVFSDAYSGTFYTKLRVWTDDAGTTDLITYGTDWTKGAGDLGTDGIWLAWSAGDGRPNPNAKFDQVHLMRGPYTTSAGAVTGTEMTTVSGLGFSTTPFVVGCGYAARQSEIALDAGPFDPLTLQVFRLSDGYRWTLPNALPLLFSRPLAISCTELFSLAAVPSGDAGNKTHYTIARVRLDSLGPGTPPD